MQKWNQRGDGLPACHDGTVAYAIHQLLPEEQRKQNGRKLLSNAIAQNPYHFLVIDAAFASLETPQGQVEVWIFFRKALNQAKGKPGRPTDGLYLTTVRNKIFGRLAVLPTPDNSKEVEQVLGFLKAEKCNRDDLLKRYRGALINERMGLQSSGSELKKKNLIGN